MSITDLAKKVGLSNTPCQVRLKRLIEDGYILGFRAIVDVKKLGKNHVAFTEVKLSDTREHALTAFNIAARKLQEVEECHMIAGAFDYLLKIARQTSPITVSYSARRYRAFLSSPVRRLLWLWRPLRKTASEEAHSFRARFKRLVSAVRRVSSLPYYLFTTNMLVRYA